MVRLSGDQVRTLMPARWPVRVLRRSYGAVVEWMLMVASADAEARYAPEGEKRTQVMPRAWERRVPLEIGMNLRCLDEIGGGVGVRARRGREGMEVELEDRERERDVSPLLEVSSLLVRLPREAECARDELWRRSDSSLPLLLGEVEYSLRWKGRPDSKEELWVDRTRFGDPSDEASEEWLEVFLRLGAGLSISIMLQQDSVPHIT